MKQKVQIKPIKQNHQKRNHSAKMVCPECGCQIREEVTACPKCGCPSSMFHIKKSKLIDSVEMDTTVDDFDALSIVDWEQPTINGEAQYCIIQKKCEKDKHDREKRYSLFLKIFFILSISFELALWISPKDDWILGFFIVITGIVVYLSLIFGWL